MTGLRKLLHDRTSCRRKRKAACRKKREMLHDRGQRDAAWQEKERERLRG